MQLSDDSVSVMLLAVEQKLERIRQHHLAKNHSLLHTLEGDAQQGVEQLTSAINEKICQEISEELRRAASNEERKRILKLLATMLELA